MHGKLWTEPEKAKLVKLWERHCDKPDRYERIAARLPGRGPDAIRIKLGKMGLKIGTLGTLTLADVGAYLGRSEHDVLNWIRRGSFIPGINHEDGIHRPYQISQDALWAWMEDKCSWHLWQPEQLTDLAARQHFAVLRAEWVTTQEAAGVLCVEPDTVAMAVERGRLAGVHLDNGRTWINRRELEAYRIRNDDNLLARVAELTARVGRLEMLLERNGIAAYGYPTKARYAVEANR